MICVEQFTFTYPPIRADGPPHTALDGVSFEMRAGGCLAVTGPNNSGKTTLCLSVAGLAPRLTGGAISGRVRVSGRDVQAERPGALGGVIGLVMQDPTGQLFNPTVEDEIAWGLGNLGLPPGEMPGRIAWALDVVGLASVPPDQPPQTLSGGQQKRLALAAALALRPKVLVLDEPAGGLSPTARLEMIEALRGLREREDLTILLTENDPAVIAALADEVLLLDAGRVMCHEPPHALYLSLRGQADTAISVPPASQFAAVVNARRALDLTCLTLDEALEQTRSYPLNGAHRGGAQVALAKPTHSSAAAVQLEDLHFAYDPARPVLRGLDIQIPTGQFVALVGDNGAGKTTLARHLIGLLRPTAGRLLLFGEDTARRSVGQLARQVGLAFQNPELQIFNPTVRDEVAFGPKNLGLRGAALEAAVEEALALFGLTGITDTPPAVLSFSTRRMVALAAIAAMRTPVLVLDEPTVGLDVAGEARVAGWLAKRHRDGVTVILITHDMEVAARHAERVLVLSAGRVTADGMPGMVFAQTDVLRQAGLEPPFAVGFAEGLGRPALAADLTPQGAAHAWLEVLV